MSETGIIYKYTCLDNNKSYIGQTIYPKERHKCHIRSKGDTKFYRALRKYSNWSYQVLEKDIPKNELDEAEIYYIALFDSYKNGYNSTIGGNIYHEQNPMYGRHHTEETKKKISDNRKGIPSYFKGKHHTEETKKKISEACTGYKFTEDQRKRLSESLKGREFSEEHRIKIGLVHKGKPKSEEMKRRISNTLKGRKLTEEHKAKCNVCKGRHRQYNDPDDHSKGWKMVY